MTSAIWSGSSRNCGIVGWPAMIPSASGRCRNFSIGYFRCNARNAGAIASALSLTLVDGVALRRNKCAQRVQASLRCRRLLCESRLARAQ